MKVEDGRPSRPSQKTDGRDYGALAAVNDGDVV